MESATLQPTVCLLIYFLLLFFPLFLSASLSTKIRTVMRKYLWLLWRSPLFAVYLNDSSLLCLLLLNIRSWLYNKLWMQLSGWSSIELRFISLQRNSCRHYCKYTSLFIAVPTIPFIFSLIHLDLARSLEIYRREFNLPQILSAIHPLEMFSPVELTRLKFMTQMTALHWRQL